MPSRHTRPTSSRMTADRAGDFLARAHQMKQNRLASGRSDAVPTPGQERRVRLMQFRNVAPAAKSTAHEGVVARPMDQNLSKILDQRRAQVQGRGTSAARIVKQGHDQAEPSLESTSNAEPVRPEDRVKKALRAANAREDAERAGDSVDRLKTAKKEMDLRDPALPPEPGNMEI